jgi:hypothetical protein
VALLGLAVLLVLVLWPGNALAWGPVTHLVHGSQVLDSLSILGPALQQMLREHRLPYLYGCVAADIVQAKKYTRSLYTHCHCWPVGWQIAAAARSEREQAFAYGYLSHLAGDVYSHNHFVPVQLIVSYQARTLRHVYWEARFDAAQERDRWRLIRKVFDHRYPDCDRLVERVRYPLTAPEIERFNTLCTGAIQDLLLRGKRSACQHADPTGRDALARAERLRLKLRTLRRRGQVNDAISAELRALAPAA